ncbi:translation initiation factor IF-2 associated domain-containing protein, partial [Caulobacter sp. 17J80-11]|uniref:translation initiation factor IF-2 associated domain-containing protein n=1 Tax=Caulobacter sp. 17J80-11 TaxID=2763502 RepID=UPI001653AEE3
MSDANDNNDGGNKPASGGRPPLTLKPRAAGSVSTGTVRQSFSHGRSKTVVVETKRRRVEGGPAEKPAQQAFEVKPRPRPETPAPEAREAKPSAAASAAAGGLSAGEMEARRRAIEGARAEQDRRDAERGAAEAAQRAQEEA